MIRGRSGSFFFVFKSDAVLACPLFWTPSPQDHAMHQKSQIAMRLRRTRSAKPPTPPKVLGRVLGEVPARNGVLGEVLGKVLVLLVPRRDTRGKHFSKHFPERPVSGRHLSEHSPGHFWGGRGSCASAGGPPRSQV